MADGQLQYLFYGAATEMAEVAMNRRWSGPADRASHLEAAAQS